MATPTTITNMATLYEEILDLYMKCYQASSPHLINRGNAHNYMMQLLATQEVTVIRRKEKVVGCVVYQIHHNILLNEKQMFIQEWFIHPTWRKKLVGKQLYDNVNRICEEQKCVRLTGICYNMDMIRTIRSHDTAKAIGLYFEKEFPHGR
jgi:ribosomal protein S18 acetylase RimI-like enzyme